MLASDKLLMQFVDEPVDVPIKCEQSSSHVKIDDICTGLASIAAKCQLVESVNRLLTLSLLHDHWKMGHCVQVTCVTCGVDNVHSEGHDACGTQGIAKSRPSSMGQPRGNSSEISDAGNQQLKLGSLSSRYIEGGCELTEAADDDHALGDAISPERSASGIANAQNNSILFPRKYHNRRKDRKFAQANLPASKQACSTKTKAKANQHPLADTESDNKCGLGLTELEEDIESKVPEAAPGTYVRSATITCRDNSGKQSECSQSSSLGIERTNSSSLFDDSSHSERAQKRYAVKPYVCCECHKAFTTGKQLRAHWPSHLKTFNCSICDAMLNSIFGLKVHVQQIHLQMKPFTCPICGKRFAQGGNMKVHMRTHTGERQYQCSVCQKNFPRSQDLRRHMLTHSQEKPYKCSRCDYACISKGQLKTHENTHSGLKPFKCSLCGKSFACAAGMRGHMRLHEGIRQFRCWACSETFMYSVELKRHMRLAGHQKPGDTKSVHVCPYCGLSFEYLSHLKEHMPVHSDYKAFVCQVCGKTFRWLRGLRNHMISHSDERKFSCGVCNKLFKFKVSLAAHAALYCGQNNQQQNTSVIKSSSPRSSRKDRAEKPLMRCDECGVTFKLFTKWQSHLKSTGHKSTLKPFVCECGKAFDRWYRLKAHGLVHAERQLFLCQECGQGFRSKENLLSHSVVHHSVCSDN